MPRHARTVSLAAVAALLAACEQPRLPEGPLGRERHKVEVTQDIDSVKVPFRRNSTRLPPSAKDGLRSFFRRIGADTDAVVVVEPPTGLRGDLGMQRRDAVLRFLRSRGYRPVASDDLMPEAPVMEKEVLVRVAQYGTVLPECPDHSRSKMGDLYNADSSNFGCATNRNLGLMVANPRDLVRGGDLAPARTTRQMHNIADYRAGKPIGNGDASGGGRMVPSMSEGE